MRLRNNMIIASSYLTNVLQLYPINIVSQLLLPQ